MLNGVVMLSFVRRLRADGLPVYEALVKGCAARLRPVLMTALTTALGAIALFWPFIDSWLERRYERHDSIVTIVGVVAFLGFLLLTVWEAFAA